MKFIMEDTDKAFIKETNERLENNEDVRLFAVKGNKIYIQLQILDTAKANAFLFNLTGLDKKDEIHDILGIEIAEINYATGDLKRDKIIGILERTLEDLRRS